MRGTPLLVWRYCIANWGKTLVLVIALWLAATLPVAIFLLLAQFSREIMSRAAATPLVAGAPGSTLDLSLHAIYFSRDVQRALNWGAMAEIDATGLGRAIPVHCRFTAQGAPLVGTSDRYFRFRRLEFSTGRIFLKPGECVLGDRVAARMQIAVGDSILSDRANVIDIAGMYPLKLKVSGILGKSGSPDDEAVFVDMKTSWIVEGLGHGHQDIAEAEKAGLTIGEKGGASIASAGVLPYTEITDDNIASFHFHGSMADFPVTSFVVDCPDEKSSVILQGRYNSPDTLIQIVEPSASISELLAIVFRTERFFRLNFALVAISTLLLMSLIVVLSVRLRRAEMETMFKIGCSRWTVLKLLAGELLLVGILATSLIGVSVWLINANAGEMVRRLITAV